MTGRLLKFDALVEENSRKGDLGAVGDRAKLLEKDLFDGVWMNETKYDPFLPLVLAAEHTERVQLGTGIAVAFARSPMTVAVTAWDLQRYSEGRFILGLGSQVKPHITRRFSMPWGSPVERMREFVEALRAIWACWDEGTRLKFEGTYYNFDLMTPYFNPGPQPYGAPKVFLAAVNKGMAALAGEVADGIKLHSFCTPLYVERVIEPAIAEGLKAAGKHRSDFEISVPSFIATGEDDVKMEAAIAATRREIGFYASTAAYRAVLDTHGWGALHEEAREQVRRGDWDTLGKLVDDEVLQTFAVVAPPDELGRRFSEMFANTNLQRVSFNFSYPTDDDLPARCRRSFGSA